MQQRGGGARTDCIKRSSLAAWLVFQAIIVDRDSIVAIACVVCCVQAYFDPWFITVYNVIFSSLPIIIVGVFDQVSRMVSLRFTALVAV